MFMLAEPRQKQKWSLNPRGKQWTEDSSKFGQRMLEKMGWTSGKGLGANEQGITEHVRVSLKNDMAGIGFKKDKLNEAWTEHQDNFNDILQKLQQDETLNIVHTDESKGALSGKSLELKSKESRVRVHYKKFTRGKDVNKYSSKDLANIFGQKELNINISNKGEQNENEENFKPTDIQDNRGGVITINSGNMTEYFMKKEQDFSSQSRNKNQQENSTRNESEYVGFEFTLISGKVNFDNNEESKEPESVCNYAFENPCAYLNSPETVLNSTSISQSFKKQKFDNGSSLSSKAKKLKEDNINENRYENGIVNAGLNLECQIDEVCNGKEFEVSRVQFGLTNTALDLSDERNDKKRVTFNDHVEYSTDCVKKKRNKITLDKFEVENKKAKKKKKLNANVNNSISYGFVNEALNVAETSEEIHDNEINECKTNKSRKRRKSWSNLETIIETPEEEKACENEREIKRIKVENNIFDDFMVPDISSNKKRKKKHKDKIEIVTENKCDKEERKEIISEINSKKVKSEICEDQESISKSKKKKRKDKIKDIEPNLKKDEHVVSGIKVMENLEAEKMKSETVKVENKKVNKNNNVNDLKPETIIIKEEKEVSDKENTKNKDENETNNVEKPKHKKLINKSVNISTRVRVFSKRTEKPRNNLITSTYPNRFNNITSHTTWTQRTWDHNTRMPKKLLMSLFQSNSVLDFPGSNIHEIKGYGADM
ncbi:PREDICTED: putative histone-lysine N-methyltransferase 1 [Eufriesea mexicana]|uniref:putative histone-lysine N-methyltransferase 1 n=1 Tax=Eufriesea mexicana TaxID=516756 RepID=UPI00083C385E|nr:PREDICTED: putative histone-lysine N-methyltransferase 1 [Eufriesea mexicana]